MAVRTTGTLLSHSRRCPQMAKARLQKTLADYLAIAATPILIILLVGSLVFFLQEMFFNGRVDRYQSRIHWVMFWYVIGMVLIARIAIESGRAHAGMFTLALGGAVSLFIFQFEKDHPLVAIGCLALIWWCADKLTWDCSLIDDSEDASGEGLLQVAGVADEAELPAGDTASGGVKSVGNDAAVSNKTESVPLWKRLFVNESERVGKPHAPGLWVVYFSLAALPLFGFGQTMLARESSRDFAFQLLVAYVLAALGLLLLTSFLGLRRYLRQRNLAMPTTMAAGWVAMGAAIAIGILVVCLLLPRPDANYSVTAMIDDLGDKLQEAADQAFLNDDGGEGQQSGPADKDAEQGSASDPNQQGKSGGEQPGQQTAQADQKHGENGDESEGNQSGQKGGSQNGEQSGDSQQTAQNGEQQSGEQSQSNSRPGDQTAQSGKREQSDGEQPEEPANQEVAQKDPQKGSDEEKADDSAQNGHEEAQQQQAGEDSDNGDSSSETPESSPPLSSAASRIGTFFKWIVYALLAGAGLYFVWKHWAEIGNWLVRLWHEFLSLFGRRPEAAAASDEGDDGTPPEPPRPFSAFRNPFGSRAAAQAQPAELVRYTFEALQAWAFENGCPRSPDQTPIEFGNRLRSSKNPVGPEASELGELYARVAYAGYRPNADCLPVLEKLWRKLT